MKSPTNPHPDSEERLESWLASQPLTPAPDFVSRTLARIRAEQQIITAAKAGDESALDSLLDGWLGESPLEPDFEPAQLATQARRTATREEQEENRRLESPPRRIILFPAWARSAVALAAAASIALVTYLGTLGTPAGNVASSTEQTPSQKVAQLDPSDDNAMPVPGSEAYNPNALSQLNDSLKDGQPLLDDNVAALLPGNYDPSDTDTAVE